MTKPIFPEEGMELTTILTVTDMASSKSFYNGILGAEVVREYGGSSCVLRFLGNWLLLVTGGGETDDKPGTAFAPPANADRIDHAFTIRVEDCRRSYEVLLERGAAFLTPPVEYDYEVRAFFRDPDGHLFEISQSKG